MALTTAEPGQAAAPLPRAPAHTLDLDARHRLESRHRDFENSFVSERKYPYPEAPPQDTKFSLEAAKPAVELAAELKRSEAAAKVALERYEGSVGGGGGGGGGPGVVGSGGPGTGALTAASCPSHTIDAILGLRSPLKGSPSPPHLHGLNNNTSTNNMNMATAASPARGGGGGGRVGGGRDDGGDTDDSSTATPPVVIHHLRSHSPSFSFPNTATVHHHHHHHNQHHHHHHHCRQTAAETHDVVDEVTLGL
ncbi:hypothetical protein E2C01_031988 [Portunus trituberculatus]|uniref:Uncharacterized protein n=1 Tax=Portunus trituberculatus TaxID=210409 RepID=A0A5B7EUW5_PORTR|nr:hypothetical protein [Portunus trituberculatus]